MNPEKINKLTEECVVQYDIDSVILDVGGAVEDFFESTAALKGGKIYEACEFFDYQTGAKLTDLEAYGHSIAVLHTEKGISTAIFKLKRLDNFHFLLLHKLDAVEKSIIRKCEYENRRDVLNMLGKISHDFNNLLGVVMGHAELANYLSDNAEARTSHLKKVMESSVKIKNIIKQILVYRHHMDEKPVEKFDLKALIDRCIVNLREGMNEAVSIKVKQVEPVYIQASVSKMTDVISNVLQNAVNAIDREGEVLVDLQAAESGFHKLIIKDNGIGMSKRTMEHMYEPFFSTQSRMKSAGVGLAIVKGILDSSGGEIDIRSTLNEGTEVVISIPVFEDSKCKGSVLLVDDEKLILGVTGEIVKSLGYEVVLCEDLEQGERALSDELFDIMLVDHHLKDGSGLDLIKYARSKGISTPAVLSCGHHRESDFSEDGIDGFLMKPTSMKDIETLFNSVLSR